jgi:glutathione S-transferase
MPNIEPLRMLGVPGSPYSRKLRAVLRYRRIPHAWVLMGSPESRALPPPRVALLPQLFLRGADGTLEAHTDSSPLIRLLETSYGGRSVIPPDPVMALIDLLLEDYADEWLTKAMFHYRWAFPADVAQATALLPRWGRPDLAEAESVSRGRTFAARQIERLAVVGSSPATAPIIEASYRRLLAALDALLQQSRFVMGSRPGAADFGLYGQLTQLAGFDPTPRAIALADAPRVIAWVDGMEDLSGVEPRDDGWVGRDAVPPSLHRLLAEVGRVYVPFLLANADALARGAAEVECIIDGRTWTQRPFPYQRKCLGWLRDAWRALGPADRAVLRRHLDGTGCEPLFDA